MGCGSSTSTQTNHALQRPPIVENEKTNDNDTSQKPFEDNDALQTLPEDNDRFNICELTIPTHVFNVKPGDTLCSNGKILVFQRGSSTIEFRLLPELQTIKVPWYHGFIRDIVWCSMRNIFLFLTKDALFGINPQSLLESQEKTKRPIRKLTIKLYHKIKPYDAKKLFWRCACAGTKLYVSYSGDGTVIDEYLLGTYSCKLVNRWAPPKTCTTYESIWSIRYQADANQLALAIINSKTNQWRLEIRSQQEFARLWQTTLPLTSSECQLSPLSDGEWLIVHSRDTRLIQVGNQKLRATMKYGHVLKNAIFIDDLYFVVRTNNAIRIHQSKQAEE